METVHNTCAYWNQLSLTAVENQPPKIASLPGLIYVDHGRAASMTSCIVWHTQRLHPSMQVSTWKQLLLQVLLLGLHAFTQIATFFIVVQRRALDKVGASVITAWCVCLGFEERIIISVVEKRTVHSSIGEGVWLAIMANGCVFG